MTVWYDSVVSWRQERQKLHVAESFYNNKRNDAVLVQSVDGTQFVALLQFLFTCSPFTDGPVHGIALVQGLDAPTGPARRKDQGLELLRLRERPRRQCEFIPVESIVRGLLAAPAYDRDGDWMLVDVLNTDMQNRVFYRIGSISGASLPSSHR